MEPRTSRPVRAGVAFFLGSFLIQAAWIFAITPFAGIDEFDHVYRAVSVADGQWAPSGKIAEDGRGELVEVSTAIIDSAHAICDWYGYTGPDNCNAVAHTSEGKALVASAAARYNPVFYWVIATPAQPFDGATAVYVMRFTASLLCSLLLGGAAWVTALWARTRWPLFGLLVACTPVALYSNSLPAPNGIEISGGIALWAALLATTRLEPDRRAPALYLAAIAVVPLAGVRGLGALWLALTAISFVTLLGVAGVWRILQQTPRAGIAFVVSGLITGVGGLAWTLWAGSMEPEGNGDFPNALGNTLRSSALWFFQAIAAFPVRNEQAPTVVYAAGFAVLITLFALALRYADRAVCRTILVTFGLAYLLPVVMELQVYSESGAIWQGRYGWPYAAGVVLLSGYALDRAASLPRWAPAGLYVGCGLWILSHVVSTVNTLQKLLDREVTAASPDWVGSSSVLVSGLTIVGAIVLVLAAAGQTAQARSVGRTREPAGVAGSTEI